jgi:hypothetical protein
MILLTSTSDKLQVITSAAATIDVHASWVDNAASTITPGRTNTAITTATTTDVVAAPAASTQRNVKTLHVRNTHATLSCDVTVQHTDGTHTVQLHKATLPAGSALEYIDEAGFLVVGVGSPPLARLDVADQLIAGGANVSSLSLTTGSITLDCGARPTQYITNNGAFTITAPSNDGSCMLLVTNGASAGTITFSGFTMANIGDPLTTTNTSKFSVFIWRINGVTGYRIAAHQ